MLSCSNDVRVRQTQKKLPVHEGLCPFCNEGCVEDEVCVLIHCPLYGVYRSRLYDLIDNADSGFMFLTDFEHIRMMQ